MTARSITITLVILTFSLLTTMFQTTGVLPNVNSQAVSTINQNSVNQIIQVQNVTSQDSTGQIGFYNMGIKVILTVLNIIIGTLAVAVPLHNLGVPLWFCVMLQPILWALVIFDLTTFFRGMTW